MPFSWKGLGKIGLGLLESVVPAVKQVEDITTLLLKTHGRGLTSAEKQELAVQYTKALLESAEGLGGQDLLNDTKIESAARKVIDAVVSFQNAVAEAKASRPTPTTDPQ